MFLTMMSEIINCSKDDQLNGKFSLFLEWASEVYLDTWFDNTHYCKEGTLSNSLSCWDIGVVII